MSRNPSMPAHQMRQHAAAPAVTQQHGHDEACFYCASDTELAQAIDGTGRRTVRMTTAPAACPHWDTLGLGEA